MIETIVDDRPPNRCHTAAVAAGVSAVSPNIHSPELLGVETVNIHLCVMVSKFTQLQI